MFTHKHTTTSNLYTLAGEVDKEGFVLCLNYYGDYEVVYFDSLEEI